MYGRVAHCKNVVLLHLRVQSTYVYHRPEVRCRYYLTAICKQPALYFMEGKLSSLVLQHCTLLRKQYRPPFWVWNPHAQTVLSGDHSCLRAW